MKIDRVPLVTIILLNYNGYDDTIACFESLCRISYKNYKIVIVDNASPDNSMNKIVNYMNSNGIASAFYKSSLDAMQSSMKAAKVTLIQSGFNGGYGHGNNIGIKYALKNKVDYVLLLNNDTIVKSNFLEPMVEMCEDDSNIGIASGKIYFYDRPDTIWFNGGTFNNRTGKIRHINYNEIDKKDSYIGNITFITGCLWLIPSHVFKDIGYINEDYFMYVEDLEFSQRVIKSGYTLKIAKESKIYHKVGNSSGGEITNFSMYWMTKNNLKYMKSNVLFIYWPLYLINNIMVFSLKWFLTKQFTLLNSQKKAVIDFILKR